LAALISIAAGVLFFLVKISSFVEFRFCVEMPNSNITKIGNKRSKNGETFVSFFMGLKN
jgi:hypothetical protein